MMSAVTTASSVCGCRTTRRTTTTPRMTKPATMARPIDLPSTPRGSRILAPEQDEPGGEDQQAAKARIHEAGRAEVRGHVDRDEQLPDDDRGHDSDGDREQPCREEGPQDVDGRRHPATGKGDEDGGGQRPDRPPDRRKRGCHARSSLRIPSARQTHSSGSGTFLLQHVYLARRHPHAHWYETRALRVKTPRACGSLVSLVGAESDWPVPSSFQRVPIRTFHDSQAGLQYPPVRTFRRQPTGKLSHLPPPSWARRRRERVWQIAMTIAGWSSMVCRRASRLGGPGAR